jgi:hypothetical protein
MEQITMGAKQLQSAVDQCLPGWKIAKCGPDMDPGIRAEFGGRKNVLMTHPLNRDVACVLSKIVELPEGKTSSLRFSVANDPRGDFLLVVKINGEPVLKKIIDDGWFAAALDLSDWAGEKVKLELLNQANDWQYEAAYWEDVQVK